MCHFNKKTDISLKTIVFGVADMNNDTPDVIWDEGDKYEG